MIMNPLYIKCGTSIKVNVLQNELHVERELEEEREREGLYDDRGGPQCETRICSLFQPQPVSGGRGPALCSHGTHESPSSHTYRMLKAAGGSLGLVSHTGVFSRCLAHIYAYAGVCVRTQRYVAVCM